MAQDAVGRKDLTAAAIQLKNALQIDPEFAPARLALGKVALEVRDYASAEKELNRALDLGQHKDEVVPLLARLYVESGQMQQLKSRFSSTRLEAPASQALLDAALGYASLADRDPILAARSFEEAMKVLPDDPFVRVGKARLLATSGKIEEARALLQPLLAEGARSAEAWLLEAEIRKALADRDGAINAYRKVYEINPGSNAARYNAITMLLDMRRLEDAKVELAKYRQVFPQALDADYLQAYVHVNTGEFQAARDSLGKVLSKAPDHTPSLMLAAIVAYELKDYAQAEQFAEKLVAKGVDSLPLRKVLIGCYLRFGRIAKAQQALAPLLKAGASNPEVLALIGQVQLASGQSDEALKSFERSASLVPSDATAQSRVGMVRLSTGDYEGGVKALESAAAKDKSMQADIVLALAHLRQRNVDLAIAALERLERKQPREPVTQNLLGAAYLLKGDIESARISFTRALEIQPDYIVAANNLARLDLAEGKPADAAKRYESILARDGNHADALIALAGLKVQVGNSHAEAESLIRKAIKAHPGMHQPRVALVELNQMLGDRAKALAAAQEAVAALPDTLPMLELLVKTQLSVGEVVQAEATQRKALAIAPTDAGVLGGLAAIQIRAKKWGEAEQSIRKGLQLRPDDAELMAQLASVYRGQNKFDDALQVAKDIQKKHSELALGHLIAGDLLLSQGKGAVAVTSFKEAYSRQPSAATLIRLATALEFDGRQRDSSRILDDWEKKHPGDVLIPIFRADAYLVKGDYGKAIDRYKAILEQSPANVPVLNNLAWALAQTANKEAVVYAERAYKLAPANLSVLDTYGRALVNAGKTNEGLDLLRRALKQSPDATGVRLALAKALIAIGKTDEARDHLEKLVSLGSKYTVFAEATALLKSL